MSSCIPRPCACPPKGVKKNRMLGRKRRKPKGKFFKAGKLTRNAFFNFLRCFRRAHAATTIIQIAVRGAKAWNSMSPERRNKYIEQARMAPKLRKRNRSRKIAGRACKCPPQHGRRSKGKLRSNKRRKAMRKKKVVC